MKAGNLLHTSEPYAHQILASQRSKRCEECFQSVTRTMSTMAALTSGTSGSDNSQAVESPTLRRCTACKVVHYCSVECQKKAWTFHKLECKSFRRVCPKIPTESVLLLLRLLQRQKRGDHKKVSEEIFGKKRTFTDLVDHVEAIKQDERRLGEFIRITQTLKAFVGDAFPLPPPDELLETFGRMVVNTFTVCDGEMMAVGVGLYLGPSALDHSCRPNAVVTMEGTKLSLRNIIDVDLKSQQICISYSDQLGLTRDRQAELSSQYYFTCDCVMCTDKDMDALMQSVKCPELNCRGALLRQTEKATYHCTHCETSFPNGSDAIVRYLALVKKSQSTLNQLKGMREEGQSKEMLATAQDLLIEQDGILHEMNVFHVKALDKAMDAAIDTGNWKDALDYGLATLEAYKHYYPNCHPNVGVQLMKIGKLQLYLQQLQEAFVSLQQAEHILMNTHGTEHSLYAELKSLLEQCCEERRVELEHTDG